MSSGMNRGKTKKDAVHTSSQPPHRDSQKPSAPGYRRPTNHSGEKYRPFTNENNTCCHKGATNHHDTLENSPHPLYVNELKFPEAPGYNSNTCPRSDNIGKLNAAAPDQVQESLHHPFQVFPPTGWPMWYNPALPPPPWLWSNAAPKVNSDKGTQVEKTEQDHVTENRQTKPSVVELSLINNAEDFNHDSKDKIVSVAVQTTDIVDKKEETLIKIDIRNEEPAPNNLPFLLSLKEQVDAR